MRMNNYHVVVELDEKGKRNVGKIIDIMEKRKFAFKEKKDRILEPGLRRETIELESRTRSQRFLDPLKTKYAKNKLEKMLQHFIYNHTDLIFETDRPIVDVEGIKAFIYLNVYPSNKKPPIICVYKED